MTIESKLGILGKGWSESSSENRGHLPHSPVKLGLWVKKPLPLESYRESRVHRGETGFSGAKVVQGPGFAAMDP